MGAILGSVLLEWDPSTAQLLAASSLSCGRESHFFIPSRSVKGQIKSQRKARRFNGQLCHLLFIIS